MNQHSVEERIHSVDNIFYQDTFLPLKFLYYSPIWLLVTSPIFFFVFSHLRCCLLFFHCVLLLASLEGRFNGLLVGFNRRIFCRLRSLGVAIGERNRQVRELRRRGTVRLRGLLAMNVEHVGHCLRVVVLVIVSVTTGRHFSFRNRVFYASEHVRVVAVLHRLVDEAAILDGVGHLAAVGVPALLLLGLRVLQVLREMELRNLVPLLLIGPILHLAAVLNRPLTAHRRQAPILLGHELLFQRVRSVTVLVEARNGGAGAVSIHRAAKVRSLVRL